MNIKKITVLLFLIVNFISASAQKDTVSLNTLITSTAKFTADYPIEKVYLHLDKPYYAANDTIWLKAYITIDKHQPSSLSNIVYVDIANGQDSIAQTLKLPVINGVASGSIVLSPEVYKQGNYHIRGYTAWMRNFDPDYFFNKNLTIGNPVNNLINTHITFNTSAVNGRIKVNADVVYKEPGNTVLANKKVSWNVAASGEDIAKGKGTTDANGVLNITFISAVTPALKSGTLSTIIDIGNRKEANSTFSLRAITGIKDVQFFPEGGELIYGVRSRIAFKAVNTNGLGMDVKGSVTDNSGTEVAVITSQHLGMGTFTMVPEEGKTYKINISFADGTKNTYDLPRIRPSGINISLYNTDPVNLTLKISANTPFFQANQNKSYYIIAQTGGVIFFAAQTKLQSQVYSAAIPKSKFPTGIIQFTLLTNTGLPVSERIIFIQHNDLLELNMTADRKIYTPKQYVKVTLSAKNKSLPVQGNFSVAVIDETKVPFDEIAETTILSNLLLTSELKGYVEKPNYYFLSKNLKAADDLDVLMLTQGYRRISYTNILAGKFPQVYLLPEQEGLQVSGILRNNTGLPIAKANMRLQINGRATTETTTDMVGNFKFSKLSFPDSTQLTLTAQNSAYSKNLVIAVNGETYQAASKNNYSSDEIANIDSTFKPYLLNSKKQYDNLHILKEVVIKSTVYKQPAHLEYPAFSGLPMDADQTINKEVLATCPSLLTCLPYMALGITAENSNFYLMRNYNSGNKTPMQIYLNSFPVDASALSVVRGDEVESVEIFKNDGVSGINKRTSTAGIIIINKKKVPKSNVSLAQLKEMLPPPNVLNFIATGYGINRVFYAPKYPLGKSSNFGADLRSTVYWNPAIITDKTGAASFDFYNADGRGTYRATIEGFDADGNLGRYVLRYTVK